MSMELVRYDGSEVYESDIRVDNLQNLYWRTREGELIAIPKLAESHLRNIALMLMGFGYVRFNAPNEIKIMWLTALRMEWERRLITFNSEHHPMHWTVKDGELVKK